MSWYGTLQLLFTVDVRGLRRYAEGLLIVQGGEFWERLDCRAVQL